MWMSNVASPLLTLGMATRFCRHASSSTFRKTSYHKLFRALVSKSRDAITSTPAKQFSTNSKGFNPRSPRLNETLGDAAKRKKDNASIVMYATSACIVMIGVSYAAVPLYKVFCQSTGLGGEVNRGHDAEQVFNMRKVEDTILEISFNADTHSSMTWNFRPQQRRITVRPGETALAFYEAKNPLTVPVVGISTYNVVPFEVAPYFNKIQCFCFEEQRLNPGEEVDLPVFFYIDPEFCQDPLLDGVTSITLSYTFFEAKEGFQIPLPAYG